jgi:Tfp pilus assembly protein PilO
MTAQMTSRERTLAAVVGTLVAVLVTFMLVKLFLTNQRTLSQQFTNKTAMLATMRTLIGERELWEQRDQWLNQQQPKLDNAGSAGVALLDQVKELGKARSLTPTEAVIGGADAGAKAAGKGVYQAVSVSFNVKGKWEDIVNFLYDVQTPTSFLVFEKAVLQLDKEDKTQVSGSFKLAKWYAAQ